VEEHTHEVEEQIYYILEGEGLMELDGDKKIVRPGLTIFIPPQVRHALYNTGTKDLTFLVVSSPPLKP
jgi:mannose-6-phosphate isomerase-like protein (cupin superfamily)